MRLRDVDWEAEYAKLEAAKVPHAERIAQPEPPTVWTVATAGLTFAGRVYERGEELIVDAAAIEEARDRTGRSWLEELGDARSFAKNGQLWLVRGALEDNPELAAELEAERAAAEEERRLAKLREARTWGARAMRKQAETEERMRAAHVAFVQSKEN